MGTRQGQLKGQNVDIFFFSFLFFGGWDEILTGRRGDVGIPNSLTSSSPPKLGYREKQVSELLYKKKEELCS